MGDNILATIPPWVIKAADEMFQPFGVDIVAALTPKPDSASTIKALEKRFLTVKEAMEYTGLHRWMLWQAEKTGKIRASKLSDAKCGRVLYDRASIDEWLGSRMKQPERPMEPASPLSAPDESPLLQLARRVGGNKAE